MKKMFLLVASTIFLMSVTAIVNANERDHTVTISKHESDVTGDGINETIELKGIPYENDEGYLKEIFIDIFTSDDKQYQIPLESGAKASLKLVDLNQDGVKDLFSNVLTGENGSMTLNYLHTLKGSTIKELVIPEPLEIASSFENGYKAKITIDQIGKTYVFDLKDRKKYYKKLGLYYKGRLNEPTELTVNSFTHLKPIRLNDGKIGLKGIQRVTGISNGDNVAYVESSYKYENKQWSLIQTNVSKSVEKSK